MNILRIDSSVRVEGSKTRALTDFFIEALKNNKAIDLIHRDVGLNIPEMPTNEFIVANYTPETDRPLCMSCWYRRHSLSCAFQAMSIISLGNDSCRFCNSSDMLAA